ncbi:hypothetical protein RRG08_014161 [Elysia crispata]|uniref:Uncharacterized protein n=1 Tax=Elysia crispata TaxID=231223 RepID=A0AAE0YZ88_9GAST|nr:hypothetical protein RRG08_014161 [Elysia crispata]
MVSPLIKLASVDDGANDKREPSLSVATKFKKLSLGVSTELRKPSLGFARNSQNHPKDHPSEIGNNTTNFLCEIEHLQRHPSKMELNEYHFADVEGTHIPSEAILNKTRKNSDK